jgi:hypothetical protein
VATDARHTKNPETIRSNPLPHTLQAAHRFLPVWTAQNFGVAFVVMDQYWAEASVCLIRRRFGIAGIKTINPLLPHLHEGTGRKIFNGLPNMVDLRKCVFPDCLHQCSAFCPHLLRTLISMEYVPCNTLP